MLGVPGPRARSSVRADAPPCASTLQGPVSTTMKHLPPRTSLIIASTLTGAPGGRTRAYYRVPEAR